MNLNKLWGVYCGIWSLQSRQVVKGLKIISINQTSMRLMKNIIEYPNLPNPISTGSFRN